MVKKAKETREEVRELRGRFRGRMKAIKIFGWLAVLFYIVDIATDLIDFPLRSVSSFPLSIRLLTFFLYTIPLGMLIYLSSKYLRSIE